MQFYVSKKKKKKSRDKHACFVVVIVKYLYCYNAEKTPGQDTTVLCKYYKGQPRLKDITVKDNKEKIKIKIKKRQTQKEESEKRLC